MSMNFSEFKKRLGADPLDNSPEMLAARATNAAFERLAEQAAADERRLRVALDLPVDPNELMGSLLAIPRQTPAQPKRWLAIAASVLVTFGVATTAWYQWRQPDSVEQYVAMHYQHDGARVLTMAEAPFDPAEVNRVLAGLQVVASDKLVQQIRFIKYCPTMHGRGAHFVVDTANGPVTVIFMPDTPVGDGKVLQFGQTLAQLVSLESGSAAIVGSAGQGLSQIAAFVRSSLRPGPVDA